MPISAFSANCINQASKSEPLGANQYIKAGKFIPCSYQENIETQLVYRLSFEISINMQLRIKIRSFDRALACCMPMRFAFSAL
jgi:hypothetical protein